MTRRLQAVGGTPQPRPKNEVWDACVEVLGFQPRTDSERRLWGKMTTSLNRGGATAGEIRVAAAEYRRRWPQADLTITALEKWFSHMLAAPAAQQRRYGRGLTTREILDLAEALPEESAPQTPSASGEEALE